MPRGSVTKKPTAIDLFSGCGGLTLGLRQAGFRVRAAVEIDPLAVKTYRKNHRGVRVWESDICLIAVPDVLRTLELKPGELDLLAGCPPCQGFSSLKTLNGHRQMRDPRNALLDDFLRFVRGLRPKTVLLENVPRLKQHRRMRLLIRELRSMGYNVRCAILNAAAYGVPQRRRRMVLIASRVGPVAFADPSNTTMTVFQAIGGLPHPHRSHDTLHRTSERRSERIRDVIASIPKNGGSRAALGVGRQLPCHQRNTGFKDIYGRLAWDDVAPTITSGCINPSKGRFLHPRQNRALTLREAALLQSFPEDYEFALDRGKYAAARMIGNALPPEFVRRIAVQLYRALNSPRPLVLKGQ